MAERFPERLMIQALPGRESVLYLRADRSELDGEKGGASGEGELATVPKGRYLALREAVEGEVERLRAWEESPRLKSPGLAMEMIEAQRGLQAILEQSKDEGRSGE